MVELDLKAMGGPELRTLLREQVAQRRAFVPGVRGVATQTPCVLVVPLPSGELRLAAEVVFARDEEPGSGVGLQLAPLPAAALAAIEAFLAGPERAPERAPEPSVGGGAKDEQEADGKGDSTEQRALHLRLRSLNGAEQRRLALTGNLAERVLLERLYGPTVWEPLLGSGRLSMPEVATIARKGTVPRPLLEVIAANSGWMSSPEVQRALLANPRTSLSAARKVLRMLPRHELTRVPMQTAYPAAVRQAAVEMLKADRR